MGGKEGRVPPLFQHNHQIEILSIGNLVVIKMQFLVNTDLFDFHS